MKPLVKRLELAGHNVLSVGYNSFKFKPEKIYKKIDSFFGHDDECFIVGWSLGGLIARNYIEKKSEASKQVKKIITLGTPHNKSHLASLFFKPLPRVIRPGAAEYLLNPSETWAENCELHSIAGTNNKGVFWLLTSRESDGTVEVQETKVDGLTSHETFHETHLSLIFSKSVTKRIIEHLQA